MADKICIDTQLLEELSHEITDLKNSLSWVSGSVSASLSEVRRVASSQTGTINRLSRTQQNLIRTIDHAGAVAKAAGKAADIWKDAENRIASLRLPESNEAPHGDGGASAYDPQAVAEAIRKSLGYPEDTSTWSKEMRDKYDELISTSYIYQNADDETVIASKDGYIIIGGGTTTVIDLTAGYIKGEMSVATYGADGSYTKQTVTAGTDKAGWDGNILYKDKDGSYKPVKLKPKEKEIIKEKADVSSERIGTILQFGTAASAEVAALHGEVSGSNGWAEGSAHYNVSHGEASASLYAGLYATKVDEKGNVHYSFEPGVDAKIGASYSVFDAEASGKIGSDNLNLHGKGEVSALKLNGEAEAQLGIVDGSIAARVDAKLEAIALEAKGEAGVNIGGIDGTVSASVNVGVGAHADIGVHDGKISCDLGLSFGVGASVSFELDFSGFVENLGNAIVGSSEFIGSLLA